MEKKRALNFGLKFDGIMFYIFMTFLGEFKRFLSSMAAHPTQKGRQITAIYSAQSLSKTAELSENAFIQKLPKGSFWGFLAAVFIMSLVKSNRKQKVVLQLYWASGFQ